MLKSEEAINWLKEAGKIAMGSFGKVEPSLKDNNTYVTEADLKVQKFLKEKFDLYYPDFGVLAEEDNLFKEPQEGKSYGCVSFDLET